MNRGELVSKDIQVEQCQRKQLTLDLANDERNVEYTSNLKEINLDVNVEVHALKVVLQQKLLFARSSVSSRLSGRTAFAARHS